MELAGIFKEGSSDRDAIAHFVWSQDEFMDKSEDELEGLIDDLEEEYNASKANYSTVEDYIEELEQSGGLEGMLSEDSSTMKTSKTSKTRLMELAGLVNVKEGITTSQRNGLFLIGSDIAKDRYDYDEESLVDDLTEYELEESDYEFIIARGDDFPNAIKITPQSISRILANQDTISFLQDLESDDDQEGEDSYPWGR